MTPFWLLQAPEIRKSLFGVLRDLKLTFLGVFRPLKWHLFSYFRFLKWGKAFLEFQGALNDYIFAFSGAWKDTLLAEKGDILISYWIELVQKRLFLPNYMYYKLGGLIDSLKTAYQTNNQVAKNGFLILWRLLVVSVVKLWFYSLSQPS